MAGRGSLSVALSTPAPTRRRQSGAVAAGIVVSVLLTVLVLRRSLGPGVVLFRDDVQVPDPRWSDALLGIGTGPPRAVPFGAVAYWLSQLVGASGAQRLVLAAPLLLAGTGVGVLLRRQGPLASSVGALVAVWNPYVVERLGLGQAPTLLAYGALPWLLAATGVRPLRRRAAWTVVAFVPAALTPVGSLIGLGTVVAGLAARRVRPLPAVLSAVGPVMLCAPWVVAGLLADVAVGEPDGAAAYAARPDSPWGLLGSVASLGGVWTPVAAPPSREQVGTGVAALLLLVVATAGWWTHRRRWWLFAGWVVPVTAVCVAAGGPAVSVLSRAQSVPGVALLRDTHRLLAPAAVALALGAGCLVGRLSPPRLVRPPAPSPARWLVHGSVAVAVAACAVLVVPDLAAVVGRQYRAVTPPSGWQQGLRLVGSDGTAVLSLPWQPLRRTRWNDDRVFLDPVPLAVAGQTLHSTQLLVRRDGRPLVTDRDVVAPSPGWLAGRLTAEELRRRHIGWVVQDRQSPGPEVQAPGLTLVLDEPELRVWRVPAAVSPSDRSTTPALVAGAGFALAGAVLLGSLLVLLRDAARRRARQGRADTT